MSKALQSVTPINVLVVTETRIISMLSEVGNPPVLADFRSGDKGAYDRYHKQQRENGVWSDEFREHLAASSQACEAASARAINFQQDRWERS